ncbi:MAG: arylsulfatase [Verrucomicrobiales bacterium]|nr:arylsulfatase [Verrucomicrobiales bacterium]
MTPKSRIPGRRLRRAWAWLAIALTGAPSARPGPPPNVLVILADDQGWGDLSLHGNGNLDTPHIDSLARDGASFERFFVQPVCSPTRAEFLTGRYHPRGGVHSTSSGGERLDLDERTIADAFRAAGYVTGAFGKWHNGTQYPYHPRGRGFDEFHGFCSGHWGNYFDPVLDHNGEIVRGRGYLPDDVTDQAMRFLETHRARPFFCYVPYNIPHSPMQVPERFFAPFADHALAQRHREPDREDPAFTRAALAMTANLDWNVGRLLDRLRALALADNTIVVYFSDNGPNSWRWNGGMKGRKGSTDEGGVRSPLLLRWPGQIPAGSRVQQIGGAIDLLPTLAGLAGIPLGDHPPLDGMSLTPWLLGHRARPVERMLFAHWNGRVSVRTQRHRLDAGGELFDLAADPGQRTPVTERHPEVAGRLRQAVAEWRAELLPGLTDDSRPFPVGYQEMPLTRLPARDAQFSGDIKRSNRFPNDSYLTNWARLDDRITWDVEVHTSGTYIAELWYACPPADVGATIELAFADRRLVGAVVEAHDPPRLGEAHDRIPRAESYVKDFKALRLGEIELPRGRGGLTLRALRIPGRQAMELRLLTLRLTGSGGGPPEGDR